MPWAKISTSEELRKPEDAKIHHEYDESSPVGSDFFIHASVFFLILTVGGCMMVIYKITMNKNNDFMKRLESKVNGKPALQRRVEAVT